MKKTLMPYVANMLCSHGVLKTRRAFAAIPRRLLGAPRKIEVFLDAADPYSFLLVQVLPELGRRFGLTIELYTLNRYPKAMFPDLGKWQKNAYQDAARLAALYDLVPPCQSLPEAERLKRAQTGLLAVEGADRALEAIHDTLVALHTGKAISERRIELAETRWRGNLERLQAKGHYLPATLYFEGEWYWGLDRLGHLERRLNTITGQQGVQFERQRACGNNERTGKVRHPHVLEMFFSARSPYSYLGLEQAVKLCRSTGITLVVKPVLPMMMRGMNVPHAKKMYIFHDTKREANRLSLPYGKVADPLGAAVERCYAVWYWASSIGKGIDFLLAFGRAVNAEGVHADTDKGLRKIIQSAGLNWAQAHSALTQSNWREVVQKHCGELSQLGLWGVPCFRYGETVVWGQDRMWVVEQAVHA